jgi:undecaprenyl pyrophosphate synthase
MLKTENKLNSLALVGRDFSCDEIVRIQEYLENLNPNSRLICIESGFARQEFLETLKNLMKSPKPITEQDITNIEFQPDLILKLGSKQNSLENSFTLGASYAEIAFCPVEAKNFKLEDLIPFLEEFEQRKRNYGV